MLTFELLRDKGILVVQPSAPLQAEDFRSLAATVDLTSRSADSWPDC